MFNKLSLTGVLACVAASATATGFKDPLDTPAQVNPGLAASSRMTAVTAAGASLVAVGPRGHILVSQDQGRTWKQSPAPVSTDLVAVRFATPTHGWAVGHDGVVLHSADGGASWTRQFDGRRALEVMKTHYTQRAQQGDAKAAALLADIDRYVEEGPGKPFLDVLFLNQQEGFVVGAFNLAFHTRDGGKSWEPLMGRIDNPKGLHLYALAQSGGQLFAAGEQGLLLRWNAEGRQFEAVESPYRGTYFGLLGSSDSLLAYGLRGNVFQSRDGGRSWARRDTGVTDAITGATALPGGGFVLSTQGGKLLAGRADGKLAEVRVQRPMAYFNVAAAGPRSVVVVGASGVRAESITSQP
ncbi:WD40/YVTN/BNR-like repeat-containing protein [Massilia niastensis]|uniref:WD40/YVTN/BNR-like repeat-containing protein n=1 Tax=Massilia niastensis TaxID=544911 RepID=UPI0012EB62F7|nr:YCF48-related protein [Massilia niastensis]